MEIKALKYAIMAAVLILPWIVIICLNRNVAIRHAIRDWRLNRIRRTALKYIDLLDRVMKTEHYTRAQRRQFWRQFVHDGRFINE